jgi:hypothetical protein
MCTEVGLDYAWSDNRFSLCDRPLLPPVAALACWHILLTASGCPIRSFDTVVWVDDSPTTRIGSRQRYWWCYCAFFFGLVQMLDDFDPLQIPPGPNQGVTDPLHKRRNPTLLLGSTLI